jgi:hypothetical protein
VSREIKCEKCKIKYQAKRFTLVGLYFTWLEDSPWICERCIAKFFGIKKDWKKSVKEFINE